MKPRLLQIIKHYPLLSICVAICFHFISCYQEPSQSMANNVLEILPASPENDQEEEEDITTPEDDKEAIMNTINNLFNGMKEGDSSLVRSVFHRDATMQTTYKDKNGQMVLKEESVDGFVQAIGAPHEKVWLEKIYDVRIELDDNLAQAWVPYKFYLGDQFSHCGVNAMQLVKEDDGTWHILMILDTRRKTGCVDLKPEH